MWIDVHTHLDMMEEGVEVTIQKAKAAGVEKLITIGTEPSDHEFVLQTARQYYPDVYCTLGVHPHQGAIYTPEIGRFIEAHASEREVVAIGEIGLDYHYNQSPHEEQKAAFRAQMQIAQNTGLPVEIHTRDAEEDTVAILREFPAVKGIIHCFTGTSWLAQEALAVGFNISISGVVTFKNADDLRQTVRNIPLDRLHIETDAPFLTPIPLRGKKNTAAYLVHTAKVVAELKGISEEELARQTKVNALQMFKKIKWDA